MSASAGDLDWWVVAVNQFGSVLFFLAGLAAFVRPATSARSTSGWSIGERSPARCVSRSAAWSRYSTNPTTTKWWFDRSHDDNSAQRGRGTSTFRQSLPHRAGAVDDFPAERDEPDGRDAAGGRGPRHGRRSATQPRDLRHDLDGARGAADHRREPAPQLHRPRGVPHLRRDRAALRADAGRSLPCAGGDDGLPHPGLVRGDHARRAVPEVEVARAPTGRRASDRPPQPGVRRRRARRLGEVLSLLRRRATHRSAGGEQVHDRPRRRGRAPR